MLKWYIMVRYYIPLFLFPYLKITPYICTHKPGSGRVANAPKPQISNKMAEQEIITKLAAIERNTLLAAKNVLDIDDVALLTGLSKSHIYKLTCNSQIPYYKPTGKHLYFDRAEVEAWMKRNRVNTQEEAEQAAIKYVVAGRVKVSGRVKGGRP